MKKALSVYHEFKKKIKKYFVPMEVLLDVRLSSLIFKKILCNFKMTLYYDKINFIIQSFNIYFSVVLHQQ